MLLRKTQEEQKISDSSCYNMDERGHPTARNKPERAKPSNPTGILGLTNNYVMWDQPPPGSHSSLETDGPTI